MVHLNQSWYTLAHTLVSLGIALKPEIQSSLICSLRAKYGKETFANALHGSDAEDTAMRYASLCNFITVYCL